MPRVFVSRAECTMRFGLMDAASIPKWKRRMWPLPAHMKSAVKIDGVVYEGKGEHDLHSHLILENNLCSQDVIEGFTYETL